MVCVCIDMEQPLGYVIYHARHPIKCPNNSARALSLEGASRESPVCVCVCVFVCVMYMLVRWLDGDVYRHWYTCALTFSQSRLSLLLSSPLCFSSGHWHIKEQ
jgi:hypothetical protein